MQLHMSPYAWGAPTAYENSGVAIGVEVVVTAPGPLCLWMEWGVHVAIM